MTIKILLLLGLSAVTLAAYRSPLNARTAALRRIVGGVVLGLGATAVLWPNILTETARALGVGRGADLVLYGLAITSLFVWVSLYRRIHDLNERIAELTRHAALQSSIAVADDLGDRNPTENDRSAN